MNKRGLGKGLGALIPESEDAAKGSVMEIKITEIAPNEGQPRKLFDDEALNSLAESIKEHGVVQPIIVRRLERGYQIIAGERRWRAARLAGLKTVPAIVKECSNVEIMELALIENLQREDLNVIEEADAYKSLIDEYNMTQEDIARRIGKSRPAIANTLRLIGLPAKVKEMVADGRISAGHARALLSLNNEKKMLELAEKIVNQNLNVRQVEKLVKDSEKAVDTKKKEKQVDLEIIELQEKLKSILGTKVTIEHKKNKGRIQIEYYSNEELDRILELLEK